jgi:hypothetical protein
MPACADRSSLLANFKCKSRTLQAGCTWALESGMSGKQTRSRWPDSAVIFVEPASEDADRNRAVGDLKSTSFLLTARGGWKA